MARVVASWGWDWHGIKMRLCVSFGMVVCAVLW